MYNPLVYNYGIILVWYNPGMVMTISFLAFLMVFISIMSAFSDEVIYLNG